jgi:hypothetical protein
VGLLVLVVVAQQQLQLHRRPPSLLRPPLSLLPSVLRRPAGGGC